MLTPPQIQSLTAALYGLILLVSVSLVLLFSSAFSLPDDKPADLNWEGMSNKLAVRQKPAPLNPRQLHGQTLFTNNCAQCDAVTEEIVVGPGLRGITGRTPNEAWLLKWIRNSQTLVASGDTYAVALYSKFNKIAMPGFSNLTDADVQAILAYIDVASVQVPAILR